ncbi:hypothetical protein [Sporomusa sp. KB1]|nr:hypothetical protein [Sporomusa sp. KB1]
MDSLLIGGFKAAQLTAVLTALAVSLLWAWCATRNQVIKTEK